MSETQSPTVEEPDRESAIGVVQSATVLGVLAAVASLFVVKLWTHDFWWHAAAGRWIIENRDIPSDDPFSYTMQGEPWTAVTWLGDLILYGAFVSSEAGWGIAALKFACAFLILLGLYRTSRSWEVSPSVATLAATMTALVVFRRFSGAHPETIGMVWMVWMIERIASSERGLRQFLPMLVLQVLWVPTHGTAILALPLFGAAWAKALHEGERNSALWASAALALSVAHFLAMPLGRAYLAHVVELDALEAYLPYVGEFTRPDFVSAVVLVPLIGAPLAVVWHGFSKRLDFSLVIVSAMGAYLATREYRYTYIGWLLVSPSLAIGMMAISERARDHGLNLIAKAGPPLAALAIVIGALLPRLESWHLRPDNGVGVDSAFVPVEEVGILESLPPGRIINDYSHGGYLIWRQYPGGVFADGRSAVVYRDWMSETYVPLLQEPGQLEEMTVELDAVYGITSARNALNDRFAESDLWRPFYYGPVVTLYVRSDRTALVEDQGFTAFEYVRVSSRVEWMRTHLASVASDPEAWGRLVAEMRLIVEDEGYGLGVIWFVSQTQEAYPEIAEALRRAIE